MNISASDFAEDDEIEYFCEVLGEAIEEWEENHGEMKNFVDVQKAIIVTLAEWNQQ